MRDPAMPLLALLLAACSRTHAPDVATSRPDAGQHSTGASSDRATDASSGVDRADAADQPEAGTAPSCADVTRAFAQFVEQHRACERSTDCRNYEATCVNGSVRGLTDHCSGAIALNLGESVRAEWDALEQATECNAWDGDRYLGCGAVCLALPPPAECMDGRCRASDTRILLPQDDAGTE